MKPALASKARQARHASAHPARPAAHLRLPVFGAICPARGTDAALVVPEVSIDAMNQRLAEISKCAASWRKHTKQ